MKTSEIEALAGRLQHVTIPEALNFAHVVAPKLLKELAALRRVMLRIYMATVREEENQGFPEETDAAGLALGRSAHQIAVEDGAIERIAPKEMA